MNVSTPVAPPAPPAVDAPSSRPRAVHWAVAMNHRNRTVNFALVFVQMGSHLWPRQAPAWVWCLLVLNLLVLPQVMYHVARRSRTPFDTEMRNMLGESVLFGIWCTALGFPAWITFSLWIGMMINLSVFWGLKGFIRVCIALLAGALPAYLIVQPLFKPDTSALTTVLSMFNLGYFLVIFSISGHERAVELTKTRAALKTSQRELEAAHAQLGERFEQISRLQGRLEQQVNEDGLTGVFNRRYFDWVLAQCADQARQNGHPLSLILLDIDHFKRVNDLHGHPAGDAMLQQAAQLFALHARKGDALCRYGGEEFALLLPSMPLHLAQERAETIRRAFAAMSVPLDSGVVLQSTVSMGVSCLPDCAATAHELVQSADQALYAAKSQGRDRVVLAATPRSGAG